MSRFESSLVAQMVKRLPEMWETWVQSLGWEDLLEKETATHSSTLAWRILWTEEPGRLQSMGSQRVGQKVISKKWMYLERNRLRRQSVGHLGRQPTLKDWLVFMGWVIS